MRRGRGPGVPPLRRAPRSRGEGLAGRGGRARAKAGDRGLQGRRRGGASRCGRPSSAVARGDRGAAILPGAGEVDCGRDRRAPGTLRRRRVEVPGSRVRGQPAARRAGPRESRRRRDPRPRDLGGSNEARDRPRAPGGEVCPPAGGRGAASARWSRAASARHGWGRESETGAGARGGEVCPRAGGRGARAPGGRVRSSARRAPRSDDPRRGRATFRGRRPGCARGRRRGLEGDRARLEEEGESSVSEHRRLLSEVLVLEAALEGADPEDAPRVGPSAARGRDRGGSSRSLHRAGSRRRGAGPPRL